MTSRKESSNQIGDNSAQINISESTGRKDVGNDSDLVQVSEEKQTTEKKRDACNLLDSEQAIAERVDKHSASQSETMLAILKLGTGSDDQSHVKRPKTASRESVTKFQNHLQQISEENQPRMSEHADMDNDDRHFAFSLRNV